jgi:hypothetical protein
MAWNDALSRATGSVLFSSGPMTLTTMDLLFHPQTIPTGGLPLAAGNQFVLFFSALNDFDGMLDGSNWGARNSIDSYGGGLFVFNNGASFSDLSNFGWNRGFWGPGYDLAFQAVFSAVPEPASIVLASTGFVGVFLSLTRRSRHRRVAKLHFS